MEKLSREHVEYLKARGFRVDYQKPGKNEVYPFLILQGVQETFGDGSEIKYCL